jgi:hypothetical protein
VVSRCASAGDDGFRDVSATSADVEPDNYRLALPWEEWKEHVAWFAPISITMISFVFIRYGRDLKNHRQLRAAVLCFCRGFVCLCGNCGFLRPMTNKCAPVQGGNTIQLRQGGEK